MCGISILVSAQPADLSGILAMNRLIRHRGPDDEGYLFIAPDRIAISGGDDTPATVFAATGLDYCPRRGGSPVPAVVAMGHRRLSIVDLSPAGHQPMSYAGGRYWIAYNGEVYNHVELRARLEAAGHVFRSHSDTEVILAAYAEWGERCLDQFNGMWALAICDRQARTLFVARDRFGVKPLYCRVGADGVLALASEIKQFTALADWQPRVDGQRACDYLAWAVQDHDERTLFDGVYALPPGHALSITLDDVGRFAAGARLPWRRWYALRPAPPVDRLDAAAAGFRERFFDAVRLRLRADVAVGSCLSGGLDSSAIVSVAAQLRRGQAPQGEQVVVSACTDAAGLDERPWMDAVVADTGVRSVRIFPDLDALFADLDRIVWHQDEPFASTSIFAQWSVFGAAAAAGVPVMLDGQGADEQLAGYPEFQSALLADLWRQRRFGECLQELAAMHRERGLPTARVAMYLADGVLPDALRDPLRRLVGAASARPPWLAPERLRARPGQPLAADTGDGLSRLQALSLTQLTRTNVPMLLHWEDRNSMAHAVESRLPFLDYRLVEYCLGLADACKLHHGVTKRVLREALAGVLAEPVRQRRSKLGFVTPESEWFRTQAPERFRRLLMEAVERCDGVIAPGILDTFDACVAGRRRYDPAFWRIACFGRWLAVFDPALA